MRYIDPDELFRCLVSEVHSGVDFSTSPLIARILTMVVESGLIGMPHAVLVDVGLGFEFVEEAAEVLVTCSLPQVFENVRDAYNDERLRFEVRTQTASMPSGMSGDAKGRDKDELTIFGLIERYCVFCTRTAIKEMIEKCRAVSNRPISGSAPPGTTHPENLRIMQSGSSGREADKCEALAAALRIAKELSGRSKTISPKDVGRK